MGSGESNSFERPLLNLLSDGRFHDGASLGAALGISRSAVWKKIQKLDGLGFKIDRVRGVGYRLSGGCDLLDGDVLAKETAGCASGVTILDVVDSTNSFAMKSAAAGGMHCHLFLAESQVAGRGRRGRTWQSPFGANIYMSFVWEFSGGVSAIQGMSLVVGLAVCRTIESFGASGISVKWPNDVVKDGRKISGILVELGGDAGGSGVAVIGVGVNVRMPESAGLLIDQPWLDLEQLLGRRVSRNELVARLVHFLRQSLEQFFRSGWSSFEAEWRRLDCLRGKSVVLSTGSSRITGVGMGVSSTGSLLLQCDEGIREYAAGEVSVRGAP